MSNFFPNLSSFLVYTGCGSGISSYKFNFLTLYIPKNVSSVYRMKYLYRIFQKSKKNATKKKFKISLKIVFLLKMPFLVISGHFRWGFSHQKIVSSLCYNIIEAQRCSFNHMSIPDEMKKTV